MVRVRTREKKQPLGAVSRKPHTSVYLRVNAQRLREILHWRVAMHTAALVQQVPGFAAVNVAKRAGAASNNPNRWKKSQLIKALTALDDATPGIKSRDWSPFVNGISYSALSNWLGCREQSRLNLLGWQRRQRMSSADYGTMFHEALELTYGYFVKHGRVPSRAWLVRCANELTDRWLDKVTAKGGNEFAIQDIERHGGIITALLPLYVDFWPKDFDGTTEWEALEGRMYTRAPVDAPVYFKGYVDGLFNLGDRPWVMDTKTRGRIDADTTSSAVNIDLQLNLYCWMVWQNTGRLPEGTRYNIIRNPQLKQKKRESLSDFIDRVAADAAERPKFYFLRFEVPLEGRKELDAFAANIGALVDDFLRWFYGVGPHYRATSACTSGKWPCHFLPWCGDDAKEQYTNYNDEDQ